MKKVVAFCVVFVAMCAVLLAYSFMENNNTHPKVAGAKEINKQNKSTNRIVYVSNATGDNDIYLMDLDSKEVRNLTNNPADDMNPQSAPDGKSLVFYSDRDGDNEIYQMDLSTLEVTQLTRNKVDDYDPDYSPDGTQIVFKSLRNDKLGDIFIMNVDGSRQKNLTKSQNSTEEWDPTFSTDGEKIYFVQRRNSDHFTDEIFVMDKDGKNITQLTSNDVPDWYPALNTQGILAFVSRDGKDSSDNIFISSNNIEERQNLSTLRGNDADPSWDKKGEHIIFINEQDGDYDIYIYNFKNQTLKLVENTKAIELSPIFL